MKKQQFVQLGVSAPLADAMSQLGITEPTPIQQEAIPAILAGNDIIGQAQTGTGKTLAFVLPILEQIDPQRDHVQALIVTPTRELAIQITEEVKRLAPLKGLRVLSAYGGQDVERQIRKLEGTVHIIVATPGRLLDHLRRETVQLHKLSVLVLDEADQMLHMGFLPDVEQIIAVTPSRRQTLLFSATMPPRIRDLAKAYMKPAVEIEVKAKRVTLDEIEQIVIKTTDREKLETLCKLIDEEKPYLAMIFCRTKLRASKLNEELQERGYSCDELHGDLSQAKREQVMKRFRDAKIQYLVATDVAARGLDVEGITHIFNYDIPHDAESYIHRIGRTGRAGQTGKAITFAAPRDDQYLELIEQGIKATLSKRSGKEPDRELDQRSERTSKRAGVGAAGRGGRRVERGTAYAAGRGRRGSERPGAAARGGRWSERADAGTTARGGRWSDRADAGTAARGGRGSERADAGTTARSGRWSERADAGTTARGGRGSERPGAAARGGRGSERTDAGTAVRGGRGSDRSDAGTTARGGRGSERADAGTTARGGRGSERSDAGATARGGRWSERANAGAAVRGGRGSERANAGAAVRGGRGSERAPTGAAQARGRQADGRAGDAGEWFSAAPGRRAAGTRATSGSGAGARGGAAGGRGGEAPRSQGRGGNAGSRGQKSSGARAGGRGPRGGGGNSGGKRKGR